MSTYLLTDLIFEADKVMLTIENFRTYDGL